MKHISRLAVLTGCAFLSTGISSCKAKSTADSPGMDSEVEFVPVAIGASYGVSVAMEAAVAVGAVYAVDCSRSVREGEIRFFCDGGLMLGKAAVQLVVNSVQSLAAGLNWSKANMVAHLASLSKLTSNTHVKASLLGTSAASGIAGAKIDPRITSQSGLANLVQGLRQSIQIQDREKKNCNFVAQYESRLLPREYKGNWMSGTSVRFLAKAPSAESAELMARHLCDEYSTVHFKIAPGMAGLPRSLNECRKPKMIVDYKEKYDTATMKCPGARACSSESNCFDIPL
ncbi:MAG: hypothetical protein ACO3A4_09485 [Silvanigrellaceae bacterium]